MLSLPSIISIQTIFFGAFAEEHSPTKVWMGWQTLADATKAGEITLRGANKYIHITEKWLGQSRLAQIEKKALNLRVS